MLSPQAALIVIELMLDEDRSELLLIGPDAMMLALGFYIFGHIRHLRFANRKRSIPILLRQASQMSLHRPVLLRFAHRYAMPMRAAHQCRR